MSVLLVEDHAPLARALRHGLEEEGYTVEIAANCTEADRKAETTVFDIIILNLMRFREAGPSLLYHWQRAGLQTPVLVLRAPGDDEDDGSQFNDWLTLPFQLDELLARLKEMADRLPRAEPAADLAVQLSWAQTPAQ